jgi:hypothetical protein
MTLKERVDRHDREIAAIRKLLLQGMKMLNRNDQQLNLLTAEVRANQQQISRLTAEVREFIASMRKGNGNGHR